MRSCKTCTHPERSQIEDLILRHHAHAKIGERFGLSLYSIYRHSKHLGRSVVCTGERPLVDRVEALMNRLESLSSKAQSAKEWHAAVGAMKEVRLSLELIARLTGQMPSAGQAVTVGVALNVNTNHSTSSLSDRDLELQLAQDVSEATNGFDPQTIDRLRRLVDRSRPALTLDAGSTS
jgi:hypothetical protein